MATTSAVAERVLVGRMPVSVADLTATFDEVLEAKFDFLVAPLFHPRFRTDGAGGPSAARQGPGTRSDLLFESRTWTTCIVGRASPWLNPESPCKAVRDASVAALKREIAWASHLSVPAVLLPPPAAVPANYANTLNGLMPQAPHIQFWLRVRLTPRGPPAGDGVEGPEDPWEAWNRFRCLCCCTAGLFVALELTADLPDDGELERWLGEPLKAVIINTKDLPDKHQVFVSNRLGYPTLARRHRQFVIRLLHFRVQFVIAGRSEHAEGLTPYIQYIDHLRREEPPADLSQRYEAPFLDYLQAPLQPLMDNLESQTYETFERDPVKYQLYETAMAAALRARPADADTLLMVVGAGRGPLVRAALRAAETAERPRVRIVAVEKNPNAVVTLRNAVLDEGWGDRVTIAAGDMRELELPGDADILVSELLGSFGDNELSPECLDGAQRFLHPERGVSIPAAYTSWMAPISSSRLWAAVRDSRPSSGPAAASEAARFDFHYVVRLHTVYHVAEAQRVFRFEHPNRAERIDNSRYAVLSFPVQRNAQVHGFAGYFDCELFGDTLMSIVPSTHSPAMQSWFPVFIPLREPFYARAGDTITVHMWRKVTDKKVWYEWCVTSPVVSGMSNAGGRTYFIGL